MTNFFKKYGVMALGVLGAFVALGNSAKAAVDPDLTAVLASSTALVTDNKLTIMLYVLGIAGLVLVISLGKIGIMMAIKWIKGAFGGGKKKR